MNFSKLFFRREFEALTGKKNIAIGIFSGVMFLTLLSLAFALGSLKELSERMNNPYTNWVNLELGKKSYRDSFPKLLSSLGDTTLLNKFALNEVIPYRISLNKFPHNKKNNSIYDRIGRVISEDDPILKNILDVENGRVKYIFKTNPEEYFLNNCGLIVTEDFLNGLGYSENLSEQKRIAVSSGIHTFYFELVAIVDQLPDRCGFAFSPCLYHYTTTNAMDDTLKASFIGGMGQSNHFYFLSQGRPPEEIKEIVANDLFEYKPERLVVKKYFLNYSDSTFLNSLIFPIDGNLNYPSPEQWNNFLTNHKFRPFQEYKCINAPSIRTVRKPDQVAFSFEDITNLKSFESFLNSNYNMKLEMAQVEEKENFGLVSRLTFIISTALFCFGLFSIILLTFFKLSSHFLSIKANLGTFKAFGLSDKMLNSVYVKVIWRFLALASMVAIIATTLIGIGLNSVFEETIFDVFNVWLYLALGIIFVGNLVMSYFLIQKLLNNTPGNLIYGR